MSSRGIPFVDFPRDGLVFDAIRRRLSIEHPDGKTV